MSIADYFQREQQNIDFSMVKNLVTMCGAGEMDSGKTLIFKC